MEEEGRGGGGEGRRRGGEEEGRGGEEEGEGSGGGGEEEGEGSGGGRGWYGNIILPAYTTMPTTVAVFLTIQPLRRRLFRFTPTCSSFGRILALCVHTYTQEE